MSQDVQLEVVRLLQAIMPPILAFVTGWLLPQPQRKGAKHDAD